MYRKQRAVAIVVVSVVLLVCCVTMYHTGYLWGQMDARSQYRTERLNRINRNLDLLIGDTRR